MTYQELTEGMSQWLNSQMRLADLDRLLRRYFHGILQKNSKDDKPLIKAEAEIAVEMLVWEANEAMRQELPANDPKTRDRTDMLCYSACSLIGYLGEAGVISFRDMHEWLYSLGGIRDRSTAFFLGLDAVAEQEAEQEAQLREKGLLPPSSLPRRSLNLKRDSRGVKSEETIVAELMEDLGFDSIKLNESRMMRCFLFGGDDDGGMIRLPYVNRLAFLLRELREMKPKGFPHNAYKLAEAWFLNSKGYKIKIKSLKVLASQFRDAETEGKIRTLLQANISKA